MIVKHVTSRCSVKMVFPFHSFFFLRILFSLNRINFCCSGPRCQLSDRCTNKRFQKRHYAQVEVFNTEKKGVGLRALQNLDW